MNAKQVATVAILLWVATVALLGFFVTKGTGVQSSDGRTVVTITEDERNFVLAEMRMLLGSVHGVIDGLAKDDMLAVARAARMGGMAMAADVNPALMMKLPLDFKTRGIGVHKAMDELAKQVEAGASSKEVLNGLASRLSECVACHAEYSLRASN